jgi:hypothetical protein
MSKSFDEKWDKLLKRTIAAAIMDARFDFVTASDWSIRRGCEFWTNEIIKIFHQWQADKAKAKEEK